MTLQAKLTVGSVLLAALTVGAISAVDLGNAMQLEFDSTLERARSLQTVAAEFVRQAVNRQRTVPLRDALRDPDLSDELVNILTESHAILEVAVVDPRDEILADSLHDRVGETAHRYPDFQELVQKKTWLEKMRLLAARKGQYYQLEQALGPPRGAPVLFVRVIVAPALIYNRLENSLTGNAVVGLVSLIGAVLVTFLASAVAFRPLGRIGRMLDLVARDEFDPAKEPSLKAGADELEVMASKVSLLGQRLRGAQFEVSDLRGNIDRLLQDLEDAVFLFNREGRLVFASGSVERFLGKERAALAGQALAEVFPPATVAGLLIEEAWRTGRAVRNRRAPWVPPGEPGSGAGVVVLLSVDPLASAPGGAATGAGLMVRLRDPEAQNKIGHRLQTADRLTAISRISSGVAHEVKNPLNAILLHVEVARAKVSRGEIDIEPQMEVVSREIVRLDRVVKTFLDFTRPVDLNLAQVPVHELLSEIEQLARPQAQAAGIRVEVRQEAEGVEVRADRDLLQQAILNVVVNAIAAMPDGGELRLEAIAAGDNVEIRVGDTGTGIPPQLREKIFRLYFTTKKEGSGIGLAMTFRIVQLHDGTIDFASEPGKGTTFCIRLPIAV